MPPPSKAFNQALGLQSSRISTHSETDQKSTDENHPDEKVTRGTPTGQDSSPNGKPLRSLEDSSQIYRSISQTSAESPKGRTGKPKNGDRSIAHPESPTIVGNSWSFFNRNDKNESRYSDDNEEDLDSIPYSPQPKNEGGEDYEDDEGDQETGAEIEGQADTTLNSSVHPPTLGKTSSFFPTRFSYRRPDSAAGLTDPLTTGSPDDKQSKLKNTLRLFRGRGKKDRPKKQSVNVDHDEEEFQEEADKAAGERAQSLIAMLTIGAAANNLIASCLLEDETGLARAPLLLSLLGLKLTDVSNSSTTRIRRFRIDLEYGVGPQRLKWSVEKNAKDLLYLHSRFKFEKWKTEVVRNFKTELPRYPIPPLKRIMEAKTRMRREGNTTDIEVDNHTSPGHDDVSIHSAHTNHTMRDQFANLRAHLSNISSLSFEHDAPPELHHVRIQKNIEYIKDVTNYLNNLIALVGLKPQSNRLFQFFEISPISSLLSYETGFKGKQGIVHIGGSAKSQGWRVGHFKANDLKGMIDRRSEKWLLIRNSYVMYVSNINSTSPLDVFLVDSKFRIIFKHDDDQSKDEDESDYDDSSVIQKKLIEATAESEVSNKIFQHLKISIENSERKLVIIPKSVMEQKLWIRSLIAMKNATVHSEDNRFNSFAPVRQDCFAQWFVDGRDYFWAVSSAMEMAKDVIFIHDWWLSPELYLRRPASGNQQFRIDRLLQRKAKQGVKIYVIIYRNVGTTVSTDSLYTKHSILSLDEENIHVIRSPNQLLQNTYFWAHHEKLCIVDQTVAFVGGIDMCYGRFDTPDHVLTDDIGATFDSLDPEKRQDLEEYAKFQTFPGKDYSNPRVKDFHRLDQPYVSMYDRTIVPRMPWHDIHMLTSGKVARDLSRHFVQRWNYLIRQKRPSRFTPLLTPPSDLTDEEVKKMGLGGTCEIQLLRSSGNWSLGLKEHEQSIQTAYLKLIETSEHFVYIENQFFITSSFIDGTEIENRIGDALVDRIIKAHNEGTNWKAVIVIPLMPGFESQVDEAEGSSVRVIMQCQYMSISRGSTSIFAKLRKYGIEPDEYIQFFSLRKWGRIGADRTLITEQLYIHAKAMIVDDRIAIIGSANINERSMRGVRDSEIASVVRDKATVKTTMDGVTYLAGKFAHTLRMRLMREHLGVNVDILDIVERRFARFEAHANTHSGIKAATNRFTKRENAAISAKVEIASRDILNEKEGTFRWKHFQLEGQSDVEEFEFDDEDDKLAHNPMSLPVSFNNRTGSHEANRGIRDRKKHSFDTRVQHSDEHKRDVYGDGIDKYKSKLARRSRLNNSKFLKELAYKAMLLNPNSSFLPDLHSVTDFLEADDFDMVDEMDESSESYITERNEERWALLKKISYLQRVAAKEHSEVEDESKRRVLAGLHASLKESLPKEKATTTENPLVDLNNLPPPHQHLDEETEASEKEEPNELHDHVPIVTLNDEETKDVINGINTPGLTHFSKFVDPYAFSDPLDPEFYEDLWFEHARRNTEIFRLVFHSQPDNQVESWKEYKHYSKMNRAFTLSQQQESRFRNHKGGQTSEDSEDASLADNGHPNKRNSQASIFVKDLQGVELLGFAPPSEDSDTPQKRKFRRQKTANGILRSKDLIPESIHEEESDLEVDQLETNGNANGVSHAFDNTDGANGSAGASNGLVINPNGSAGTAKTANGNGITKRRRRAHTFTRKRLHRGETIFERDTAERILSEIQGHLVCFPTEWLLRELEGENWFYNTDRIPPIEIYD